MSCILGKTGTRFTVNSEVFVILFWFLVEHFKLSARTKDARDTRDAFLEYVYPCIARALQKNFKILLGKLIHNCPPNHAITCTNPSIIFVVTNFLRSIQTITIWSRLKANDQNSYQE